MKQRNCMNCAHHGYGVDKNEIQISLCFMRGEQLEFGPSGRKKSKLRVGMQVDDVEKQAEKCPNFYTGTDD